MIKSLLKKAALLLVLQPLVFLQVFSQEANFDSWEIDESSLTDGQILMVASEHKTIKIRVSAWKEPSPVGMTMRIYRKPRGTNSCGCPIATTTAFTITAADFPPGEIFTTKEFDVSLYAGPDSNINGLTLRNGDKIFVGVDKGNNQYWGSSKEYGVRVDWLSTAPRDLKATVQATSCAGLTLSWSAPLTGTIIDRYVVAYTKPGANIKYVSVAANTRTVAIDNLDASTAYTFGVSAVNNAGESPQATITATSDAPVPGTARNSAINVALTGSTFTYTRTVDNSPANCFRNDFVADASNEFNGEPTDDIFFKVDLGYYGKFQISTCGSFEQENIRIHVLDQNGKWMRHVVEPYPPVCASYNTSRTMDVVPGVYYVVLERAANTTPGAINVKMSIDRSNVPGWTWTQPIHLGELSRCGGYFNSLNNINPTFYDQYGSPGDDVFYRFSLAEPTMVRISNCSEIHNFAIYLFDSNLQFITSGDPLEPCYMSARMLPAGEYTVAFEAEPDNYPFTYGMPIGIETQNCTSRSSIASTAVASEALQSYQQPESEENVIAIYPIPAGGVLTIDVHAVVLYSVSITDIYGLPVKAWSALQGKNTLDISQVKEGVYVVKVRAGGQTTVRRVEVKR